MCESCNMIRAGPFLTLRSPLGVTPAMLNRDTQLPAAKPVSKPALTPREKPNLTRRSYQRFAITRKDVLRATSSLRLQSRAVDFRLVWWDKELQNPSREGMSLWRASPPAGYVALGTSTSKNSVARY